MKFVLKTLEDFAETLDIILRYKKPRFHPAILVFSSFSLTIASSFCKNAIFCIFMILGILLLVVLMGIDKSRFVKLSLIVFIFLLIITTPRLLMSRGAVHLSVKMDLSSPFVVEIKLSKELLFLLRTFTAFLVLEFFIAYMGWISFYEGLILLRFPRKLAFMLLMFVMYIPIILRDTANRLLARFMRLPKFGIKRSWYILSATVSDIMLNSIHISRIRAYAMKLRCINDLALRRNYNLSAWDITVLSLSLIISALMVV